MLRRRSTTLNGKRDDHQGIMGDKAAILSICGTSAFQNVCIMLLAQFKQKRNLLKSHLHQTLPDFGSFVCASSEEIFPHFPLNP